MVEDERILKALNCLISLDLVLGRDRYVAILDELQFFDLSSLTLRASVIAGFRATEDFDKACMHLAIGLTLLPKTPIFPALLAHLVYSRDERQEVVANRILEVGWRKHSWKERLNRGQKRSYMALPSKDAPNDAAI